MSVVNSAPVLISSGSLDVTFGGDDLRTAARRNAVERRLLPVVELGGRRCFDERALDVCFSLVPARCGALAITCSQHGARITQKTP